MRRWVRAAACALSAALIPLAGCGSGLPNGPVTLIVYADASLSSVFPTIARAFTAEHPNVDFRFTFDQSPIITSQIAHAVAADVYAGEDASLAELLRKPGLIDPWQPFASDHLVLVVPTSNQAGIASWEDLARPGLTIAVAPRGTILGEATRASLAEMAGRIGDRTFDDGVLANAAETPDAGRILSDVAEGTVDAGFVYGIDATAGGAGVTLIDLPPEARAPSTYPIAVVAVARQEGWAKRFVEFVLADPAQELLRAAGLGPPPAASPAPTGTLKPYP